LQDKKTVEQRSAEANLKKELGLLALTAVGVGGMIGSGIFSLPAVMASVSGPSFLYGLLLTGILVTFLALPYTELRFSNHGWSVCVA
jgi:APA family basic amino acid/polyamine antiporter